jgi:hypothetical protein
MIETPADYRSFVFCTANKNPVSSSNALGFPEFCFLHGKQKSSQFEQCSRVSRVLFFARQTKIQSVRAMLSGFQSFVFCTANKNPVSSSNALGFPEFCFFNLKIFQIVSELVSVSTIIIYLCANNTTT